jgi:hypothetical protein
MLLAQFWSNWSTEFTIMFFCIGLPIGGGLLCGIVAIIAENTRKTRVAEAEARLKEAMIAQGRPSDEIERVIKATAYGKKKDQA